MNALPPDISQDDKSVIFGTLNRNLNRLILQALLHGEAVPIPLFLKYLLNACLAGLYTGIVTVTLWTMCMITDLNGYRDSLLNSEYSLFSEAHAQYIPVYNHHRTLYSLDDTVRD